MVEVGGQRREVMVDRNDSAGMERLVKQHLNDVWRFVSSRVARTDDAEDVTMEVMHAALKGIRKLRDPAAMKPWMLGIARMRVTDFVRRKYRSREVPLEGAVEMPGMTLSSRSVEIRRALATLPDKNRDALIMKYVNGLSTEEVALALGCSIPAANSMLQRSREMVRTRCQGIFDGD